MGTELKKLKYFAMMLRNPDKCIIHHTTAKALMKRGIRGIIIYGENLNSKEHHITESLRVKCLFTKGAINAPLNGVVPTDVACAALHDWEIGNGIATAMDMLSRALVKHYRNIPALIIEKAA